MPASIPSHALRRAEGARPWVYGHRGMRGAPENTLPAFERALAHGADGVELDVRLCKSGEVVVMHDPDLRRMAGRSERVSELTLAELQRIDLGGGAYAPLLREVLDTVLRQHKFVNVELKPDVPDLPALCDAVAHLLSGLTTEQRTLIVVSSFAAEALTLLHARMPQQPVGFLYETISQSTCRPQLPHYGEHPRHTLLDAAAMTRIRQHAAFVNTWTVNEPKDAKRLAALGVDAIISDLPDVVLAAVTST